MILCCCSMFFCSGNKNILLKGFITTLAAWPVILGSYMIPGLPEGEISKLKEHMQYCVEHPEEISKLAKVKAQVSEVKGVMMENIEKVLDRGGKIELLVDKTENLHHQAQDFQTSGMNMRRKIWLQNMKIKLIVLGILIALILVVILSACGGFNCGKK
ncbi:hypothetical protein RHMOL_Rhmol13G0153200 [Rhododendron molle]|uniref:Uncharacterized protein n=1 Tax=Rhododendron molle TaxID=49168 RepID=A0ACC0L8E1_RHOML|nr:hypothetical protein RHMOL_Rhmol13G0153200 [Rhododendron molle]